MSDDLSTADSRGLHEPFATTLASIGAHATLVWLVNVLATQTAALRSSNAFLVAYTGCADAIDIVLLECLDCQCRSFKKRARFDFRRVSYSLSVQVRNNAGRHAAEV
jgi:hypothetical protein